MLTPLLAQAFSHFSLEGIMRLPGFVSLSAHKGKGTFPLQYKPLLNI